jgi:hypothetical protein
MTAPRPPLAAVFSPCSGPGRSAQRARFYLLCALAALLVMSGALLLGVRPWRGTPGGLKDLLPANVDMRFSRLTLNEIGADGRSMILNAVSALYNQTRDAFTLDDVSAKVSHGAGAYDITAASGLYEQAAKIITLSGRVLVADNDGGVLAADRLTLKFAEGLLITDRPFCYATPEADLEGSAFVYRVRDQVLTVEGRTHLLF